MTPTEQLTAWRDELAQELVQFETEHETLRVELADAERQVEARKAAYAGLQKSCTRTLGPFSDGLAGPIWRRLEDARQDMLREVALIRGNLPGRAKALEELISGRRLAVSQIDRALQAGQPRHVPEVVRRPLTPQVTPYRLIAEVSNV